MEIAKLVILVCCTYYSTAGSSNSHTIPVEEYDTSLQDLGQHVEYPETPVRVIKITKTIAVKVPVPYPVKVIEKVPYPVHIAKPYPVQVPHIVKVPQETQHKAAHEGEVHSYQPAHQPLSHEDASYNVHENTPSEESSYTPQGYSFGGSDGHNFGAAKDSSEENVGSSYDAPASPYGNYQADGNHDTGSFESQSYDAAVQDYLKKHASGNHGAPTNYHY